MKYQELKQCTMCGEELPKTSEHFVKHYHSQRKKSYYEGKCRKCLKEYNRAYRKANADKFRQRQREWTQTPKGAYKSLKNSTRGHKVKISQKKFVEWYKLQPKKCCYCGIETKQLQLVIDAYNNKTYRLSVDRIDSSKGYQVGNLALCCLRCNHIKGNFFTQLEMVEIGEKYIKPKWRQNAIQN